MKKRPGLIPAAFDSTPAKNGRSFRRYRPMTKASKAKLQPAPVRLIDSNDIRVGERLRGLDTDKVDAIAASMASVGQLAPIIVRRAQKSGDGAKKYVLVAGAHRLKAATKLGWEQIQAREFIAAGSIAWEQLTVEDAADLVEIDENLMRADLSPAERADHVGRRKEIYERAHPETKHGAAPGKAGGGKKAKDVNFTPFAEATAKATGQSKSTVEKDAKRAKVLGADNMAKLKGTSLDKGDEMDAVCKLSENERYALIDRATGGEQVSAKAELAAKKSGAKPEPRGTKALRKRAESLGYFLNCRDDGKFRLTEITEDGPGRVISCDELDDVARQLDIIEQQPAPAASDPATAPTLPADTKAKETVVALIEEASAKFNEAAALIKTLPKPQPELVEGIRSCARLFAEAVGVNVAGAPADFIREIGAEAAETFARAIFTELGVDAADASSALSEAPKGNGLKPGDALIWKEDYAPTKEDGGYHRTLADAIPGKLDYFIGLHFNADGKPAGQELTRRTYKRNGALEEEMFLGLRLPADDSSVADLKVIAQEDWNAGRWNAGGGK
jgi:ParB/RepB/Spo0J family partition protein